MQDLEEVNIEEAEKTEEKIKITKTIINAPARESLVVFNKARKVAEKLFKDSKILEIRNEKPLIPEGTTIEEIQKLNQEQGFKNFSKMIDSILENEENIDTFFELVSILVFLPQEKVENMPLNELITPLFNVFGSEKVINFLSLLVK